MIHDVPTSTGNEAIEASAQSLVQSGERVLGVIPAGTLQQSTMRRMLLPYLYFSFRTPLRAIVITDRRILVATRGLYRRSTLRRLVSEHALSTPIEGSFSDGNAVVASEYRVRGLGRGRLYIQEHDVPTLNNLTRPRTDS